MIMKNNVVLIGMPGCGKTTVGRILAEKMQKKFIDIDDLIIETTGKDAAEYLAELGDEGFLSFESKIAEGVDQDNAIIACSGSVPLEETGMSHLKEGAIVVWMDVPLELIKKRVGDRSDTTTRIVGAQTMTLDEILRLRHEKYNENKDIQFIVTDGEIPAEENADKIFTLLTDFEGGNE